MTFDAALANLGRRMAEFGVLIGSKPIEAADETAFLDPRLNPTSANLPRRRASGAARIVASRLLAKMGRGDAPPVGRREHGAPLWPDGVLGSIAHDEQVAVVAVAASDGPLAALGVDVEDALPLPDDLIDLVLTREERRAATARPLLGRMIFAAKEAVYKAIQPLEGTHLEYRDIACSPDAKAARLADGRSLPLFWIDSPRLVVVSALVR